MELVAIQDYYLNVMDDMDTGMPGSVHLGKLVQLTNERTQWGCGKQFWWSNSKHKLTMVTSYLVPHIPR